MKLDTAYLNLALQIIGAVDRGETATYSEVVNNLTSPGSDALTWLKMRLPNDLDLGLHFADRTAWDTINEHLATCAGGGDLGSYGLTGNNGLLAIASWCIDAVQSLLYPGP